METSQLSNSGHRPPLFTDQALLSLIIPIVIERFLDMTIGIADIVMVASCGEAAVSGVSMVDNVNNLIIFILSALATGGAVVVSQYLGRDEAKNARIAAKQLLYITVLLATVLMGIALIFRIDLLRLLFGSMEADVMENAKIYFLITSLSFPFIGMFNSMAAMFRSMGNSKTTMFASALMNTVNIAGNAILIYGLGWGAAGAATASLLSRIVAAIFLLVLIHKPVGPVYLRRLFKFDIRPHMIKNILRIGIPSGLENGIFHLGRVLTQSLISTFGTAAIAANAMVNSVLNVATVPGSAMSLAMITVVGQCIGAREYGQAVSQAKRLMKYAYLSMGALCALIFILTEPLLGLFNLSAEATQMGTSLMRIAAVAIATFWPSSFTFPNMLRAAGDARFSMIVSITSMWIVRIGMSYLINELFHLGLNSVWYAMFADWVVRSAVFLLRYKSGVWKTKKVIE